MKKFLLTLALTVMCAFGLTACGEEASKDSFMDAETAKAAVESIMDGLVADAAYINTGMYTAEEMYGDDKEAIAVLEAAAASLEETGGYKGVIADSVKVSGSEKDFTLSFTYEGPKRNADVEIYMKDGSITAMFSPCYTLGEQMSKAGMNTLMGMGTVFAVLILIMALIYLFAFIPKIEKSLADKKAKKNSADTSASVDNTIAQIIENEELSDDTELVAVIAAAIAAYEGSGSADGVVIRSIRRANTNKWQRA